MTLNTYPKPLIRPLISLLLVNQEFSKTKKQQKILTDQIMLLNIQEVGLRLTVPYFISVINKKPKTNMNIYKSCELE